MTFLPLRLPPPSVLTAFNPKRKENSRLRELGGFNVITLLSLRVYSVFAADALWRGRMYVAFAFAPLWRVSCVLDG